MKWPKWRVKIWKPGRFEWGDEFDSYDRAHLNAKIENLRSSGDIYTVVPAPREDSKT